MTLMKYAGTTGLVLPFVLALLLQSGPCRKTEEPGAGAAQVSPTTKGTPSGKDTPTSVSPPANAGAEKVREMLREGLWGGAHVGLTVTAAGAEVEFDCAHGEIGRRIELDAEGRFDVAGTFVPEGGPVSVPVNGDAVQKSLPARYLGRVEGEKMTLTVTLTETGNTLEEFSLSHGVGPRLEKCY